MPGANSRLTRGLAEDPRQCALIYARTVPQVTAQGAQPAGRGSAGMVARERERLGPCHGARGCRSSENVKTASGSCSADPRRALKFLYLIRCILQNAHIKPNNKTWARQIGALRTPKIVFSYPTCRVGIASDAGTFVPTPSPASARVPLAVFFSALICRWRIPPRSPC